MTSQVEVHACRLLCLTGSGVCIGDPDDRPSIARRQPSLAADRMLIADVLVHPWKWMDGTVTTAADGVLQEDMHPFSSLAWSKLQIQANQGSNIPDERQCFSMGPGGSVLLSVHCNIRLRYKSNYSRVYNILSRHDISSVSVSEQD